MSLNLDKIRSPEAFIHVLKWYSYTVNDTDHAGNTRAQCPVHDDKHPSLLIYADGHAHCYACGQHFISVIDYLAVQFSTTAQRIIPMLTEIECIRPFIEENVETKIMRTAPQILEEKLVDYRIAWNCIRDELGCEHPPDESYWSTRSIPKSVIYKMRFCTIDTVQFSSYLADSFDSATLLGIGLLRETARTQHTLPKRVWAWQMGGVPYVNGIPSFTTHEQMSGLQFIRPLHASNYDTPRFLTICNEGLIGHTYPWDLNKPIWLCEGASDTATLQTIGLQAVGIMGLGVTQNLHKIIPENAVVIVAFDRPEFRDSPEEIAALRVRRQFHNCFRVYPDEKDWNDDLKAGWLTKRGLTTKQIPLSAMPIFLPENEVVGG